MALTRLEQDALGQFAVPEGAYYGVDTARAAENFPISGLRLPRSFIRALGAIKREAAVVNGELGLIPAEFVAPIVQAAGEVRDGAWDGEFIVDVFQTGSGTSTNMNANEVISSRANEILTGQRFGEAAKIHPNDHVNYGQSSNDVIPTAIHVAALTEIRAKLLPALSALQASLFDKSTEFDGVIKTGRTHLMDATPIRLGQEFRGYAGQVERARHRILAGSLGLKECALGGTAVGTGINTHPEFAERVLANIAASEEIAIQETENHFQAQSTLDGVVEMSGQLRSVAISLVKVANDIRLMGSGPRAGLAELELAALQPGSSIMPGKVNPVLPEAVIQVAAQVVGNDATIAMCGQWGFFELNTMMPTAAYNLLQSIDLLANVSELFRSKCIEGLRATDAGPASVERGLSLGTALATVLGYDRATRLAQEAGRTGRTIRELALEQDRLPVDELDRLLDARSMTGP